MPHRTCFVCKKLQKIPTNRKSYLILDDKIVCSKECVLNWIKNGGVRQAIPMGILPNTNRSSVMKSDYEKNFAAFLTKNYILWEYEPFVFNVGNGFYIPDFYLPYYHCFLETKGKWGLSQKKKFLKFRKEWDTIDILVVSWILQEQFYPKSMNKLELK